MKILQPNTFVKIINCAMWSLYGMLVVHPDSVLVVTINGCGFVIELIYIAIFLTYSSNAKRVSSTTKK